MNFAIPHFNCDNEDVNAAFRIAMGDLSGNIQPFQGPLQAEPLPTILAGLDYDRPWTRDAAINCWNGGSLLFPTVARQTLESVLKQDENQTLLIGGQYWDAIIWATGAWQYFLASGDTGFLKTATEAVLNSLRFLENTEQDAQDGLFRGAACYGDGIAAYPDVWANLQGHSCILDWPRFNPEKKAPNGYGIPMKTLSTNCLYYHAYCVAAQMAEKVHTLKAKLYGEKAEKLKAAINHHFWDDSVGRYKYLLSPLGDSDYQEGLGHAFAILFGIADADQTAKIFENLYSAPAGIPCVWPTFPRYQLDKHAFGRHSGTVWPHVQGFWAQAAACFEKDTIFDHEFFSLTKFANRDSQFTEIYHPETGEIYGGLQEKKDGSIGMFRSCRRQTWSASAYLSMILFGCAGMRIRDNGIDFEPYLPKDITRLEIGPIFYRRTEVTVRLSGSGRKVRKVFFNDAAVAEPFLPCDMNGQVVVDIEL